jgi:membrane-associated phospholipid phosphatase
VRGTKELSAGEKIRSIVIAALIMAIGLIFFKFVPMSIFGRDILFDASMHLTVACLVLYILWYFVDQNKSWRIPFFIFSAAVVIIISEQRVIADAHNDIGLLAGLLLSIIAIAVSRWKYFRRRISF